MRMVFNRVLCTWHLKAWCFYYNWEWRKSYYWRVIAECVFKNTGFLITGLLHRHTYLELLMRRLVYVLFNSVISECDIKTGLFHMEMGESWRTRDTVQKNNWVSNWGKLPQLTLLTFNQVWADIQLDSEVCVRNSEISSQKHTSIHAHTHTHTHVCTHKERKMLPHTQTIPCQKNTEVLRPNGPWRFRQSMSCFCSIMHRVQLIFCLTWNYGLSQLWNADGDVKYFRRISSLDSPFSALAGPQDHALYTPTKPQS